MSSAFEMHASDYALKKSEALLAYLIDTFNQLAWTTSSNMPAHLAWTSSSSTANITYFSTMIRISFSAILGNT